MQTDQIQRFAFEDYKIRGEIVRLQSTYRAALDKHDYPKNLQDLLGQSLCAASLMSSTVNMDGSLSLQCQSKGPVTLLLAECRHHYQLRGLAKWNESLTEDAEFSSLFQDGHLVITIDANSQEDTYQALVEMQGDNLAAYLNNYFKQAEQLNTMMWLATDANYAAGLLLQALPSDEDDASENAHWEHVTQLANTIKPEELLSLNNETILHRLFNQDDIRLFEPKPVCFRCTCSRDKLENVIQQLGQEEARAIIAEQGKITADCGFCHQGYEFDSIDVERLFSAHTPPETHSKH